MTKPTSDISRLRIEMLSYLDEYKSGVSKTGEDLYPEHVIDFMWFLGELGIRCVHIMIHGE